MLLAFTDEQAAGVIRIAIESKNSEAPDTVARTCCSAGCLVQVREADGCCLQRLLPAPYPTSPQPSR